MSQNQTERFGLHLWAPEDDFLREEFNENFAAIDAVVREKCGLVTGTYRGDDTMEQAIVLGFRPVLVVVCTDTATMENGGVHYGGVFLDTPAASAHTICTVTDTGFIVRSEGGYHANESFYTYHFLAFKR